MVTCPECGEKVDVYPIGAPVGYCHTCHKAQVVPDWRGVMTAKAAYKLEYITREEYLSLRRKDK